MRYRLPFLMGSKWGRGLLLLAAIAAPIVAYLLWPTDVLARMGYGFIPAAVWVAAFAAALLFRPRLALDAWRGWLSGAFLVAAALGILSLFEGTAGITRAETLGGYWGQLLGGYPLYYGLPKIAGLFTVASLVVMPRFTLRLYRRLGEELLAFAWLIAFLLMRSAVLIWRYIREHTPTLRDLSEPILRPLRSAARSASSLPGKLSIKGRTPGWRQITRSRARPAARRTKGAETHEEAASGDSSIDQTEPALKGRLPQGKEVEEAAPEAPEEAPQEGSTWVLPPVEMLNRLPAQSVSEEALQNMADHIERTLAEHGLEVKVESIRPGPRVILFGLAPGFVRRQGNGRAGHGEGARVKVDSIMAREKDLALALKTPSIRLWSPIPGEDVVGIEVPNPRPNLVSLRTIVESGAFERIRRSGGLPMALGEATGGEPVAIDLKEMPHLLIAGATGSGKSVCINSLVSSLVLTKDPQELRLLMVDPKRVELTPFNGVPHLLMPVIVDVERAIQAFGGVLNEMFRRYRVMEQAGTRTVDAYNRKAAEPLPHIVVIVDELADLMMTAAYEVEQSLVRLAQLGRATGIHLILATQRPSVNVVTGLMKANIAARIAFAVASQVDSRVILDMAGAEKLLSKGDMLFLSPSEPKPQRVQGAYISDKEIERLVLYWRSQHGPITQFSLRSEGLPIPDEEDAGERDDQDSRLLARAREVASRHKRLSPSVLQRQMRIGYAKALQLIEKLEEEGTVAPGDPGTSRLVLIGSNSDRESR
jgi:S-DNA-T family DNA segregation ATPase FtsK/SpoIIIE